MKEPLTFRSPTETFLSKLVLMKMMSVRELHIEPLEVQGSNHNDVHFPFPILILMCFLIKFLARRIFLQFQEHFWGIGKRQKGLLIKFVVIHFFHIEV